MSTTEERRRWETVTAKLRRDLKEVGEDEHVQNALLVLDVDSDDGDNDSVFSFWP